MKEKCILVYYVFYAYIRIEKKMRLPCVGYPECKMRTSSQLSLIHTEKRNISNDFYLESLEMARDFPELAFSQLPLNEVLARANNETGRILNSMARTRFL